MRLIQLYLRGDKVISLKMALYFKWFLWIVLALLGGNSLATYEKPSIETAEIWDPHYLSSLLVWSFILILVQWWNVAAVRFAFYLRIPSLTPEIVFGLKVGLYFLLFLYIVPFCTKQMHRFFILSFDSMGLQLAPQAEASFILNRWVMAHVSFLIFYYGFLTKKHLEEVNSAQAKELAEFKYEKQRDLYKADLDSTFMMVRKGNTGFRLNRRGVFVHDNRRSKDIKDLLDFGYVELSKGVYINKGDVLKYDVSACRVYLSEELMEVFNKMLRDNKKLRDLHDAIKSEHGLLYLSPTITRCNKLD